MAQKFKSGFCWFRIDGYSCIVRIINRNKDGTYDVALDFQLFQNIPENELRPIRGDEV